GAGVPDRRAARPGAAPDGPDALCPRGELAGGVPGACFRPRERILLPAPQDALRTTRQKERDMVASPLNFKIGSGSTSASSSPEIRGLADMSLFVARRLGLVAAAAIAVAACSPEST